MSGSTTCVKRMAVLLFLMCAAIPAVRGQTIINSTGCVTNWESWEQWSGLGTCSECQLGVQGVASRFRNQSCEEDDMMCTDTKQFQREDYTCFGNGDPRDGKYTHWTEWGNTGRCTALCGPGGAEQSRTRTCTHPEPGCGGADCRSMGAARQTQIRGLCYLRRSCGSLCFKNQAGVLPYTLRGYSGFYLYCNRGSVYVIRCPSNLFQFGLRNYYILRRVCRSKSTKGRSRVPYAPLKSSSRLAVLTY